MIAVMAVLLVAMVLQSGDLALSAKRERAMRLSRYRQRSDVDGWSGSPVDAHLGLARAPPRAGLGLRRSRPGSVDAVHGQ